MYARTECPKQNFLNLGRKFLLLCNYFLYTLQETKEEPDH